MRAWKQIAGSLVAVGTLATAVLGAGQVGTGSPESTAAPRAITSRSALPPGTERIVLAGGCFWGVSAVFERVAGVRSVLVGYTGGGAETARYDAVSTGTTGHAESTEIVYDPQRVRLGSLLRIFFLIAHDPTERDRQGPDEGPQYRSEIFVTRPDQAETARAVIDGLTRERAFTAPIVTQIAPLEAFYEAEPYHQRYLDTHPDDPYVVVNDRPKVDALRTRFPELARPT